jgi:AbrB family looped-hinge helix DNA binding protein
MTRSTVVTISPKFQVVIPRAIRESMGLLPGQKVQALQYQDRIEFIPVKPMKAMRGFLRGVDAAGRSGPGQAPPGRVGQGQAPPLRPGQGQVPPVRPGSGGVRP